MVLRKRVAIIDWERGPKSAPNDGQKKPCNYRTVSHENVSLSSDENRTLPNISPLTLMLNMAHSSFSKGSFDKNKRAKWP